MYYCDDVNCIRQKLIENLDQQPFCLERKATEFDVFFFHQVLNNGACHPFLRRKKKTPKSRIIIERKKNELEMFELKRNVLIYGIK